MNEDERLYDIYRELDYILSEIDEILREKEIVVDSSEYGKKAIYKSEMLNGIIVRLVNDGTFSIGGNVTKQQKQEYINDLKKIIRDNYMETTEYGDDIYTIINAIERSIEEPDRDKEIEDADNIRYATNEPFELKIPENSESEETQESSETPDNPEPPENSESEETPDSPETPTPPVGKLSVVFDAVKGIYTLNAGKEKLASLKPSETMNKEMSKKVIKKAAIKSGCKEKDLERYLDTSVYALLTMYDEKYKTDYANEFAKVAVKPLGKKESLPFDLVYRLSKTERADDLDKKDYKDIVTLAKNYKEAGIATIEEVNKKDDVSKEKNSKDRRDKKGIIGAVMHLGAEAISAIVNFGYSVKDVLTGKKKFRELFSRQAFKRLDTPKKEESKKQVKTQYNDQPNTEIRLRIRKIIHEKTQDVDDTIKKKKIMLETIQKMAKDRNIDLKDKEGKEKTYKQLEKEVADLETKKYQENKVGYVLKEELGNKDKKDDKDQSSSKRRESDKSGQTH